MKMLFALVYVLLSFASNAGDAEEKILNTAEEIGAILPSKSATNQATQEQAPTKKPRKKIRKQSDYVILNVGGQTFETTRSTLCKYPSPLAKMFSQKEIRHAHEVESRVFIDDDSRGFELLLLYLRYNKIFVSNLEDAELFESIADKWCPILRGAISEWMVQFRDIPQENLEVISRYNQKGDKNWYLCRTRDGSTIGCSEYGFVKKTSPEQCLAEFNERKIFKMLCYAWSGLGYSIYNCNNGKKIGGCGKDFETNGFVSRIENYLALDLITNAVQVDNSHIYVCNFNSLGNFSIYNAVNATNMLKEQTFSTVWECLKSIKENIKNGTLGPEGF